MKNAPTAAKPETSSANPAMVKPTPKDGSPISDTAATSSVKDAPSIAAIVAIMSAATIIKARALILARIVCSSGISIPISSAARDTAQFSRCAKKLSDCAVTRRDTQNVMYAKTDYAQAVSYGIVGYPQADEPQRRIAEGKRDIPQRQIFGQSSLHLLYLRNAPIPYPRRLSAANTSFMLPERKPCKSSVT